jgi:hypothetical protein
MFLQRGLYVPWNLRGQFVPWGQRTVGTVRWGSIDPGRHQSPTGFKCRVTLPVDGRPSAVRSTRRELERIAPVVQALDQAVHPTKAQRLVYRVLVSDRRDPGVLFVENEPDLGLRVMVPGEPLPPLVGGRWRKRLHVPEGSRTNLSTNIRQPERRQYTRQCRTTRTRYRARGGPRSCLCRPRLKSVTMCP